MRRLPVYLLLDTSGSMMGEAIEAVKNGMQELVASLRKDPYALETAYLSVITFDTSAKQIIPLTELSMFQTPDLKASGATALGEALSLLAQKIDTEVTKSSQEVKGDWKPLVFIMTDGGPTDNWEKGLKELQTKKTGEIIACAAGPSAKTEVLKKISGTVVELATADSKSISAFFKWISSSVSQAGINLEKNGADLSGPSELPPPPPEVNLVV
ncbi:MAG: VWA domain-containing protein [Tannerellaceae bacterium]|jgi:uncharacterized protein YegL|nr:VWA domain-containing protein [Tannerellaceae bacterium]